MASLILGEVGVLGGPWAQKDSRELAGLLTTGRNAGSRWEKAAPTPRGDTVSLFQLDALWISLLHHWLSVTHILATKVAHCRPQIPAA